MWQIIGHNTRLLREVEDSNYAKWCRREPKNLSQKRFGFECYSGLSTVLLELQHHHPEVASAPNWQAMPPAIPDTLPKYAQVAKTLESQILSGKWEGGRMPSVRGVATIHKVSVVTASRALQVLRDKGLIQTIERSGCYRVPQPDAERWAVVLHLTPGPWQRANVSISRMGFESLARRQPMHLEFNAFEITPDITLAEATRATELAREAGIQGLFMLPSRANEQDTIAERVFLQGCHASELPVVLLERNLRDQVELQHDLSGMDDLNAASQCVQHLIDIGRKRIGIIVASPTSTHNDRIAGYLLKMHLARTLGSKLGTDFTYVLIR